MNLPIGEDAYLWLCINFQNQINVGIRVFNSLNRHEKNIFFSFNLINFVLSTNFNQEKEIKIKGKIIKYRDTGLIKNF